ncbi:MAG: hypothetical protein GY832_24135, partial [Chloroflexi bacterium]|nr:hypothetical protein [Chloroflexota bacterium]
WLGASFLRRLKPSSVITGIYIPVIQHSLAVTLGGIAEKPVVVDGQIEIRELLSVTVSFDHDIVDGAPAARFTQQFTDLIERGYGLVEQDATPEQNS